MEATQKKNKYEIDMCNGTIMDKLISFALPLMVSSILQLLFNAVDIIVVGRFTGSQALAAVGSNTALINMFVNLFIGVSLGANVLSARFYAAGKEREMSETVHTAMTFALISGIVMVFVGLFCTRGALELMDTPADVIDQAALYMKIYFCSMPFFMLYNYGAAVLRAVGDTKRPLLFLIISGAINAVLNLFLVIAFSMGVGGVAIATVISQVISGVLVLWCLFTTDSCYRLQISKLGIKGEYLLQIFQVGVPAGIQSVVINFSNVLLQSSVNSITQACMSFTSQNYGAGKKKRMDRVLIDCMILSVIVAVTLGGSANLFGPQLLHIYTTDADVIACGTEILLYTTLTYFLCGIMDLIPGALRGMGHSAVPMILSIIGTVGTRIFWIYEVFPTHRSLMVLFLSYPASWLATILLQAVCFYFVRKKVHSTMPQEEPL